MIPVALLAALAGAPAPAQPADPGLPAEEKPAGFAPGVGWATIQFNDASGMQVVQNGVAVEFRFHHPLRQRFGVDVTATWGITDWARGKEWIDAGNSAGAWTTDKIQDVTHWVEEGTDDKGLRFIGAVFADMFLVMTYAAVPVCYVGSVGGATSHLQLDLTGNVRATGGPLDAWLEGGLGVAFLPSNFVEWDYAMGPVVGAGIEAGPLRFGARLLWSPSGLTSTQRADESVVIGSATVGARF